MIDDSKHGWPQGKAVVGFLNAHEITCEDFLLVASIDCWNFIERTLIDK